MASNNYNAYNHPYQQSSAIPYSAYQTAPAANNVAQSRQYQQTPTTQPQEYMSYSAQPCGGQSSGYGTGQESSWNESNFGTTRETTSRAAEVLHNMSNNAYTPNTTSTNPSSFTAVANATAQLNRYSNIPTHSLQAQTQSQTMQSSYAQSHGRPNSVNANRMQTNANRGLPTPATTGEYHSQRSQTLYNQQQQQRSASPAQNPYNNTSTSSARDAAVTATVNQYNEYNARQLPSVDTSRNSQNATSSTFNYANTSLTASAPNTSVPDMYGGSNATTVDPTAVYDPWPEYQRKQEVLRAQKAAEDAAREEVERKAEEERKMEEQRREESEERLRPTPKQKAKKPQKQSNASEDEADLEPPAGSKEVLESEIRAMMAKMRELNSKDPALLARIWEEERKAKAPRSPTTQNRPPQSEASQPTQTLQVTIGGQVANSRKKAAPKESFHGKTAKQAAQPTAPALPSKAVAVANRPGGSTFWPPEKKAHLANAAITFLKVQNPYHSLQPGHILGMLDSNPSYLQLCEQLEETGLRLDRSAFAKSLLTAVPDINSASQRAAPQPPSTASVQRPQAPLAVMKNEIATPAAASPQHAPIATSPSAGASPAATPALVAQMVPIKPELKPPANKEEAARKRKISDLVDLTLLSEDDDFGPPPKKPNADSMYSMGDPHPHLQDAMIVDAEPGIKNFPIATDRPAQLPQPVQPPPEITRRDYVGVLDKKKALRRNTYNPATIARDVLLACGRHPSERSLNQHLDVLRANLPQFSFDSDLSTIRWDILDPGKPPPGYFKDVLQALTEDADDEDDSDDENKVSRPRAPSTSIGGGSGAQARVQALPEATNPFKQKKRGPQRHSLPGDLTPATPKRPSVSSTMSASVPRSASPASGVGYQAFRSATEYGPDGQPLPKKRGRPVGWRKAIHGSPAAQARPAANGFTGPFQHKPSQPSSLRNVKTGQIEPIRIDSRSPSVVNRVPQYQAYKCKWQSCSAELHNLETLKKHVFKVHRKETVNHTLECLWDDCGKEVTDSDPMTNMRLEQHIPYSFDLESAWHAHIQRKHFDPLSWKLGDGPASGLSDSHDSEAYLSDAQGRQLTPRIVVDPERLQVHYTSLQSPIHARKGGRGRSQKTSEGWDDPHEAQARLVSQKKRIGGPGMDRGGATLVNDKRRRGLDDGDEAEEELVDAED